MLTRALKQMTTLHSLSTQIIYEVQDAPEKNLNGTEIRKALSCSITPSIDRLDSQLLLSSIWSWTVDSPAVVPAGTVATDSCGILNTGLQGRWTDADCVTGLDLYSACVSADRQEWVLSTTTSKPDPLLVLCPAGYVFGAPSRSIENTKLLAAANAASVQQVCNKLAPYCTIAC
jgi:hypothetical protein